VSCVHVERQTHFALSSPDFDGFLAYMRNRNIAFYDMQGTQGAMNTRPDGMRAIFLQSPTGYWFEVNDWKHEG